jgi:hypothetical protein
MPGPVKVDWVVGLPRALGGMAAISAGVAFANRLPERRMRLAFCALLLLTAVLLALRVDRSRVWFRGMRWPHHSHQGDDGDGAAGFSDDFASKDANLILAPEQITDVIAYILSLRERC